MNAEYSKMDEVYDVVRTVFVEHADREFRIEVLEDMKNTVHDRFSARVYIATHFTATPATPDDGHSREIKAWSFISHFRAVQPDTVNSALTQAIDYIDGNFPG